MYTPITDRELKKASNFELGKDYYVKNGNGSWYKGKLKNLDIWHDGDTVNGRKRIFGRSIDSNVGINPEEVIYELDLESSLELPPFPEYFIFGGKKIKTEDLSEKEIDLILYRWKPKQ
jgi:hypothetical protein